MNRSPFPFFARLRACALLAAALLVAGCSAVQFGYRHADTFLAWSVDDFFELDHAQKEMLKPGIGRLLAWHRAEQLPDYAKFMEAVAARLNGPVGADDVKWLLDEARARYLAVMERAVVEGAPVLARLTPRQVDEFEQRLGKDNAKFSAKYLKDELGVGQKKSAERFVDNAEYWFGTLSREQVKKIRAIAAEGATGNAQRLAERQRVQRELLALLREENTPATLATRLKAWVANWEAGRNSASKAALAKSGEELQRMMLAVTDTLSAAQREHALERLRGYAEEMRMLAAMPVT
jgi:hypothetical protein